MCCSNIEIKMMNAKKVPWLFKKKLLPPPQRLKAGYATGDNCTFACLYLSTYIRCQMNVIILHNYIVFVYPLFEHVRGVCMHIVCKKRTPFASAVSGCIREHLCDLE